MSLPSPRFGSTHGVLQLRDFVQRLPEKDEAFIRAVAPEFPNVVSRQLLPAGAPPNAPHLVLASTSSQLAVSGAQVDFEVPFYGDYVDDLDRALTYVERKMAAALRGIAAMDATCTMAGVVSSLRFPIAGEDEHAAAARILDRQLKVDVDPALIQDAMARVAVRVRDKYFVTLTLSNFEERHFSRPVISGVPIRVHPWDTELAGIGLELTIDVNNNLEARATRDETVVTEQGLGAIIGMLRETAMRVGPTFAEDGRVSTEDLEVAATI